MLTPSGPRRVKRLDGIRRSQPVRPATPTYRRSNPRQLRTTPAKPKVWLPIYGYVAAAIVILAIIVMLPHKTSSGQNVVASFFQRVSAEALAKQESQRLATLKPAIDGIITANPNLNIGASVIDLKTGSRMDAGQQSPFDGASTTKVLTAAAYLKSVEDGRNQLTDPVGAYTGEYQLKQMINQSNNDSWNLLVKEVGLSRLEAYSRLIGLASYETKSNTLTAADEATLLQKLYTGQLLYPQHTNLLLGFMQKTNNEEMIPAAITSDAAIYHKYGQLDGALHDAAIVSYQGRPFVLVVYTSGQSGSDYPARAKLIRQIAQTVITNRTGW